MSKVVKVRVVCGAPWVATDQLLLSPLLSQSSVVYGSSIFIADSYFIFWFILYLIQVPFLILWLQHFSGSSFCVMNRGPCDFPEKRAINIIVLQRLCSIVLMPVPSLFTTDVPYRTVAFFGSSFLEL